MMLNDIPTDVDIQLRGAVRHAQQMVLASKDGSSARIAVARFALARVVTLLEAECRN